MLLLKFPYQLKLTVTQRITQHYNRVYKQKTAPGVASAEIESLMHKIVEQAPKPPRKCRITQYYSRTNYAQRIKPAFMEEWARVSLLPLSEGQKAPCRVNIRNHVTQSLWDAESDTFQRFTIANLEREHTAALDAHREATAVHGNCSPEDYHQ